MNNLNLLDELEDDDGWEDATPSLEIDYFWKPWEDSPKENEINSKEVRGLFLEFRKFQSRMLDERTNQPKEFWNVLLQTKQGVVAVANDIVKQRLEENNVEPGMGVFAEYTGKKRSRTGRMYHTFNVRVKRFTVDEPQEVRTALAPKEDAQAKEVISKITEVIIQTGVIDIFDADAMKTAIVEKATRMCDNKQITPEMLVRVKEELSNK